MRGRGQIKAAAILVAALAAVGCSSSDETGTPSQNSARMRPISRTDESVALRVSDKTFNGPPVETGPVSFADGEAAYQAGDYSKATRVFERYTVEKPNNAWGHFMLGLSAWKVGEPAMSEKAFEEALRIDPNHVKSLVNLSRVLIEQKRFDEAVSKLTHASEIDSNSAEVNRLMGRTYHDQGKIEDAEASYRRAIELDGKDAWSMNNLGFLLLEQGRPGDALPVLAKAVELRKDVPTFHNNLGMALEHTGRFAAAAAEYSSALAADPGYEKAKQNLARVEAVKVNSEEPFDLEATAKGAGDTVIPSIPANEPTEGK